MSYKNIFNKKISLSSIELPLTLIYLKNWILIKVSGKDSTQYLHNQFTCDIKNLEKNQYSFAAYCNNKGKMISNMYVFHYKNQKIAFITPLNIHQKQILIMKKYTIFSNVVIQPAYNVKLIGVAGLNSRQYLNIFFNVLPNKTNTIVHYPNITLLYFNLPKERFLLIFNNELSLIQLLNKSQDFSIQYNDHHQWIALDIEAGYPYIDDKTSDCFFPQAANLDILKGISFNKGCYLGQELIARIQYRKLNKQSLYKLSGILELDKKHALLPSPGDNVELQINNQSWKNIGTILQSCQINNHNIWMQAILNKSIDKYRTPNLRILHIDNEKKLYISINKIF